VELTTQLPVSTHSTAIFTCRSPVCSYRKCFWLRHWLRCIVRCSDR